MRSEDIELQGFEDGYYGHPRKPPSLQVLVYMQGYWDGCHERRIQDAILDELCEQWRKDDEAEPIGGEGAMR